MADQAKAKTGLAKWVRRRIWIQAGFLALWLDPLMLRLHNICGGVFHCYSCPLALVACPIGLIAQFSALHVVPFIAIGTLVVIGGLLGSLACGWACPFGFLQDLIGKIPTPRLRLPAWTSHFRYVVLIGLVFVVPFLFGKDHPLFICSVCPAGALEAALPHTAKLALTGEAVVWPNPVKMTILVLVIVAMFFKRRPWCTILCPLGAIFGLFNRASVVVLKFTRGSCTECGRCHKECRYGVLPDRMLTDSRCNRCLECTGCNAFTLGTVLDRNATGRGPTAPLKGGPA